MTSHDDKRGFVLDQGRLRRTKRQRQIDYVNDAANALADIFNPRPVGWAPAGFRHDETPFWPHEDGAAQLDRHQATVRRLFS